MIYRISVLGILLLLMTTTTSGQGIRKHYTEMTDSERIAYIAALDNLIADGTTEVFVDYHADPDNDGLNGNSSSGPDVDSYIHGVQIFLPWHRQFTWEFEKELQAEDPNVTIPYWDWTGASDPNTAIVSEGRNSPLWNNTQISALSWTDNFIGKYDNDPNLNLNRFTGGSNLNLAGLVDNLMDETNYIDFWVALEGPIHGPPHGWTSFTMTDPMISPRDPVFYLHHSMVDRLWQIWTEKGYSYSLPSTMPTYDGTITSVPDVDPNDIKDSRTLGIFYSDAIAQQTTLEQYTVNNNTLPTEKFVYQYLIVAENDFIVPNGGDAELRSCEKIVLDGDFKVELGGSFFAMVDTDCDFGTAARVASVQDEPIRQVEVETGNRPWKGVKVYPNPFMGTNLQFEFTLEEADEISLEITNTFGQVLQQPLTTEFLEAGSHAFNLGELSMSPGIYYLVLRTTSGKIESFRVVKMQ